MWHVCFYVFVPRGAVYAGPRVPEGAIVLCEMAVNSNAEIQGMRAKLSELQLVLLNLLVLHDQYGCNV